MAPTLTSPALADLLLWLSGRSRICAAHVSCCWWCRAGWFCLCRHASMVPFELYRSEICNTNQFKWVDQTRRTRGDVSEPANRSCSMSVVCVWKPDLSAYWSHFQRAAQERSAWTRSPTAAEMKGTAWRNISRPSSSRHRKPFFKTSDPTAKSNAFTRPPLWHICQEKIHVCVEREKKKEKFSWEKPV